MLNVGFFLQRESNINKCSRPFFSRQGFNNKVRYSISSDSGLGDSGFETKVNVVKNIDSDPVGSETF